MRLFPKSVARVKAVAASLAAVAALVALLVWRPEGILSVILALCCVLLGMIAGVTVAAARQAHDVEPPAASPPSGQRAPGGSGVDADTLDALDSRAVRDSRAVPGSRTVNGVSDR